MEKILICYFSASGVTRRVAERIGVAVNGTIFEIEPVDKYTERDLDWTDNQSRSSVEMNDKTIRPAIVRKVDNIDDYDKIIVGFPVWWYTAPAIIDTFFEEIDFSDKDIYLFVTSGSSSADKSFKDLQVKYDKINFVSAKRFTGNEKIEDYESWLMEKNS